MAKLIVIIMLIAISLARANIWNWLDEDQNTLDNIEEKCTYGENKRECCGNRKCYIHHPNIKVESLCVTDQLCLNGKSFTSESLKCEPCINGTNGKNGVNGTNGICTEPCVNGTNGATPIPVFDGTSLTFNVSGQLIPPIPVNLQGPGFNGTLSGDLTVINGTITTESLITSTIMCSASTSSINVTCPMNLPLNSTIAGVNVFEPQYAYLYTLAPPNVLVPPGAAIKYANVHVISSGITYNTSTGELTLRFPGVYELEYYVHSETAAPSIGISFGSGPIPGSQYVSFNTIFMSGTFIINTSSPDVAVSVVNTLAFDLVLYSGVPSAVIASLALHRIA